MRKRGQEPFSLGSASDLIIVTPAPSNTRKHLERVSFTSYQVSSSTITPTYDADGNLTNNGNGQAYAWDAENRLVTITYAGGATSNFNHDALGRRVNIVEKDNTGTVTSTQQQIVELLGGHEAQFRN